MELQHTFTVPASVDQAWSTLLDVEGIAPCFPGATLTAVEGETFAGAVKVKLGPVSLQYSGKGRFIERDEATHLVVLEANGTDKRGNGTAGATVHARLEPAGENTTRVVVDTDLKVTGRPAQFGRGMLQDVGGKIIDQFAGCLAARMSEPAAGAPDDVSPSPASPQEAPAAGSAGGAPASAAAAEGLAAGAPSTATSTATAAANGVAPASRPEAPRPAPPAPAAAELDLNAMVLPALARQYGPALLAGLLALVVVRLLLRRRR